MKPMWKDQTCNFRWYYDGVRLRCDMPATWVYRNGKHFAWRCDEHAKRARSFGHEPERVTKR